jgi:hypothetical protein
LIYFFALKTKEMAVSLPIVFLLYEVLINGKSLAGLMPGSAYAPRKEAWKWLRGLATRLFIPFLLTLLYLAIKIHDMGRLVSDAAPYSRSHPYFLDFSFGSLLEGYAWYWNVLLGWNLDPLVWLVVWLGLAGWFLWRKNRWALFWLLYIFVTFVPVIGMVNRRLPYYWYIPFLGVAGLGSLLVVWLQGKAKAGLSRRCCVGTGILLFLAVGFFQWRHQNSITRIQMIWVNGVTAENRLFVQTLRMLPPPPPGSHIYFESVPRYFDPTAARSCVQVFFRDTTLNASIISPCPSQAACCLAVQGGQVVPQRWPSSN